MKKLLLITACVLSAFASQAQNTDSLNWQKINENMYCVSADHGKLVVTHDGKAISDDVQLKSGATISAAGNITWADKSKTKLNPGYCIDENGAIYVPGNPLTEHQLPNGKATANRMK